jgi:hypothetical protein
MLDGLIAGKVFGDPERRMGKGDKPFVVAKVRAQTSDGKILIINVITFNDAPMPCFVKRAYGPFWCSHHHDRDRRVRIDLAASMIRWLAYA